MTHDARFGLSLSLKEALQADPSADAVALAALLDETVVPPPRALSPRWRTGLAGAVLAAAVLGSQTYAAAAPAPTLEGRWAMAPAQSSFREDLTGPAPDAVTVLVTRDDRDRLTYRLVEQRGGAEVAQGAYDLSFAGAPSTSTTDGVRRRVLAERDAQGGVVIRARGAAELKAVIRLRRTGPDTAVLEHDLEGADGSVPLERISLVRSDTPRLAQASSQPARR